MAVCTYQTDAGETLWKVYVNVRSKINQILRAQRRVSGFKTQKEAKREELKLLRECEREVFEKENQGERWSAVVESYEGFLCQQEKEGKIQATTVVDTMAALRRHSTPWSKRSASGITKADVRELITQLKAQGYSASHQKRMKVVLNRVFIFGIESRLIPNLEQSPAIGIPIGRDDEKKPEILTLSEIRKLLETAQKLNDPWYPIWSMALLTGMRHGELYALEWSDVDFENNKISVNKSYNSRFKTIKGTKAGYWRAVPISSELRFLLINLKADADSGGRKHVLPRLWRWTMGMQAEELRKFCEGIGITSIRFHALRACFATQLIRSGVPPIQIQKICGWRDLKTMQRYIRMAGIEIEGATETLKVLPEFELANRASKMFAPKVEA